MTRRPAIDGNLGAHIDIPTAWLWLTCTFPGRVVQPSLGPDELTAHELAVLLGRSRRSVRRAIQEGHFVRVGYLPKRGVVVRVTADQRRAWHNITPADAWAAAAQQDPTLPPWGTSWYSMEQLTARSGNHRDFIRARLRRRGTRMIEWDRDTPFLTQRRFYVPSPDTLLMRPSTKLTRAP